MRTIVEAPPGSTITLAAPAEPLTNLRLSSDPSATAITVQNLCDTHPYTQSEAIKQIKKRCSGLPKFNSHDIQSIRLKEAISHDNRPDLVHKPHAQSSPQYSEGFVDFVCVAVGANANYLQECRQYYRDLRYPSKSL